MARYLLDTDVIVDFLNRRPPALRLLRELTAANETLCVCSIVLAETYSGLGQRQMPRARELLDSCAYLSSSEVIATQAGAWRYHYARQGIQLSTTDVLVASTARHHGATVITGNVRDYPMPEIMVLPLPR